MAALMKKEKETYRSCQEKDSNAKSWSTNNSALINNCGSRIERDSWVLPLVLGLDAWVFSLHLQTCGLMLKSLFQHQEVKNQKVNSLSCGCPTSVSLNGSQIPVHMCVKTRWVPRRKVWKERENSSGSWLITAHILEFHKS